uniref:Retrovirus-related Pol polyprotein from transposon TNT 1-94 n=1 Tax=Zeugodacus cucurbitae TaxID=28588 RepID=A0A0A1WFC7_ZEUCU
MSEGEDVREHMNKFSKIVDELAEVTIELQEELLVIMLLASLPGSYENLVVALEARDNLPKLDALKIKVAEEGERRRDNCTDASHNGFENTQACAARANSKKYNETKTLSNNRSEGERTSAQTEHSRSKAKRNFKCFNCGKKGHYAAQCREERAKEKSLAVFAEAKRQQQNSNVWCIDSGATSHMCTDEHLFVRMNEHSERIELAGKYSVDAKGIGDVVVKTSGWNFKLTKCLYVPDLLMNFISIPKIDEKGFKATFENGCAVVRDKEDNSVIFKANKENSLYVIRDKIQSCNITRAENTVMWHNRYGHINFRSLSELSNKNIVNGIDSISNANDIVCVSCVKSKICSQPFVASENRAKNILDLVHSDVCGPFSTQSHGGSRYFLTFIDDKSRSMFVYFLKTKDQVFENFKLFKAMVELQTGSKIKTLRTDNGREYVNNNFKRFLGECGIRHQLTVPYTPQQNGVAERANRTLVEMARCMLVHAGLSESYWAEAINCAVYIRNRSPSKALDGVTPYEIWVERKPVVKHFKVFGCLAIALNKSQHSKFQQKGNEYVMVGYDSASKAYRLFDTKTRTVIVKRDVKFDETILMGKNKGEDFSPMEVAQFTLEGADPIQHVAEEEEQSDYEDAVESNSSIDDEMRDCPEHQQMRRGRPRLIRTGLPGRPRKQQSAVNLAYTENVKVPVSVEEAMNSKQAHEWWCAMQEEYNALVNNDTWEQAAVPKGHKVIGCKWVFAVKTNANGDIERYKARLVAKGCGQTYGVNYKEIFSPVVRYATIRMVLAIAAEYELHVHQLDVSTAYLNGKLEDDIYMRQPEMFQQDNDCVLKLKKSLYGLKQSGRVWNSRLDEVLKEMGFSACNSEPCLYTKNQGRKLNIIAVYVDDLMIACSDLGELMQIKQQISSIFQIVDKGPINKFLGMEIERVGSVGAISICQKQQLQQLLHKYDMDVCRPVYTPLEPSFQVNCNESNCRKVNAAEYKSLIGSLMFIAVNTRPDILHSVCKLAQRNSDPHCEHLAAAKHVLRYLKATINLKLHYRKTGEWVKGYVDADWGGDATDRKSYTGYAFFFGGSVFSWESRKQPTVALSSTEAEYMALSAAAKESVYINKLWTEMKMYDKGGSIVINGDNMSAMSLVKNPVYHARSKHIDIKFHHIRDVYSNNEIELNYCPSNAMVADVLTKNLKRVNHCKFTEILGLK